MASRRENALDLMPKCIVFEKYIFALQNILE